jgi:sialate O-acetylesterase
LKGFAIKGQDGKYEWAKAKIEGNRVIVWNDTVSSPVSVRYDWADNPDGNLKNKAGLPASPFTTE